MSVFIEKISIKNLLSFDEEGISDFELKPLNVLIGANASGKSNFITGIAILSSFADYNVRDVIQHLGGMNELLNLKSKNPKTEIEAEISLPSEQLRAIYKVIYGEPSGWFTIDAEKLLVYSGDARPPQWTRKLPDAVKNSIVYQIQIPDGEEMRYVKANSPGHNIHAAGDAQHSVVIEGKARSLSATNFSDRSRSLFQFGLHDSIRILGNQLKQVAGRGIYPVFGPMTLKVPNEAGVPQDSLSRDGSNLASHVAVLDEKLIVERQILPRIAEVYPSITGIGTTIRGGRVFITIKEKGNKKVVLQPRLSDGLLRLIALLSVLFQESPPPLICIEEPENGFHPEVIPVIAKALIEASERTQIIVTTHSDHLVSLMNPEHIVICERGAKGAGGTKLRRLDPGKMKKWLRDFSLGELWLSGQIGGVRY